MSDPRYEHRFYPARFHKKGPGAWGLCDHSCDDKIIDLGYGKLTAYLLAELLNKVGVSPEWERNFNVMFEER